MFNSIPVVVLISTLAFEVVQLGRVQDSNDLLQETINRVNASLIDHYNRIQVNTDAALNNPSIVEVEKKVTAIITDRNETLSALENTMTKKNEETSVLGPEYAQCVQFEAALRIIQVATTSMKACALPAEEFLVSYGLMMDDYIETTHSVSQFAYNRVFDCVPEGDDLTEDEINDAVKCINYEQFGAHHSLNLLEQMLISYEYNGENSAGLLVDEAGKCLDKELEMATVDSDELIEKIDSCVASGGQDQKVTMEDLQDTIDETNATLTERYLTVSERLSEMMDSEFIEEAIRDTKMKIEVENEKVVRMSNSTFQVIEEMEESGKYGRCLVGVREKAQEILEEAVGHLPECVVPLEDLDMDYHEDLVFVESMLETEKENARINVIACVPFGVDLSEEEISVVMNCVDAESLKAERSFGAIEQGLNSLVQEIVYNVDVMTSDARRCVDTSAHVAGDRTGYLRYTLDQCKAEVDSGGQNLIQVTLHDLLDTSNTTLQQRFSIVDDEINKALNSQTILKATNQKITNSEEPLNNLGKQVEEKVSDAESKNFTDCILGIREDSIWILEDTVDSIRECVSPIREMSNVYEEQILASVEQFGTIRDALIKRVYDCVPVTSQAASDEEMEEAMRCVDSETLKGLQSMSIQEQMIRTNVERSIDRAKKLSSDAADCVDERISRASAEIHELIQDVDDCVMALTYTGF